jgi:hypothetical protein
MKTPRVQDFDPTAKVPQLGSPMDNLPSIKLPDKKPESMISRKDESPKGRKEEIMISGKPESQVSGNQAIMNARKPENRKVPKYSTQLPEELQIEVSVFATRHHMADYEVVWKAIEEYLEKHT